MLATIFRYTLLGAALLSAPVASWLAGHHVIYQVVEFAAGLLALFLRPPRLGAKRPEDDL